MAFNVVEYVFDFITLTKTQWKEEDTFTIEVTEDVQNSRHCVKLVIDTVTSCGFNFNEIVTCKRFFNKAKLFAESLQSSEDVANNLYFTDMAKEYTKYFSVAFDDGCVKLNLVKMKNMCNLKDRKVLSVLILNCDNTTILNSSMNLYRKLQRIKYIFSSTNIYFSMFLSNLNFKSSFNELNEMPYLFNEIKTSFSAPNLYVESDSSTNLVFFKICYSKLTLEYKTNCTMACAPYLSNAPEPHILLYVTLNCGLTLKIPPEALPAFVKAFQLQYFGLTVLDCENVVPNECGTLLIPDVIVKLEANKCKDLKSCGLIFNFLFQIEPLQSKSLDLDYWENNFPGIIQDEKCQQCITSIMNSSFIEFKKSKNDKDMNSSIKLTSKAICDISMASTNEAFRSACYTMMNVDSSLEFQEKLKKSLECMSNAEMNETHQDEEQWSMLNTV